MLQPSPAADTSSPFERFRTGAGRRALAIGLALLIEGLMLLLLLTLNAEHPEGEEDGAIVVNIVADEVAEEEVQEESRDAPQPAETPPVPQPPTLQPAPSIQPPPAPAAPPILRTPFQLPPAQRAPAAPARPPAPAGPLYGPPDTGRPAYMRDTERVGTAPNGEPLYAAAWYREPKDEMLADYLSTAREPGWGLIACRTAPDYRVEDCVGLAEYPEGSQIVRAMLAAAWEFKVRPPRRGGESLVGSWVRIRIDYTRN